SQKKLARDVRNMVTQNLENLPSISDIASQLGTNNTTLRRAFKATYGVTLMDYIRIQRLEMARIMLREGRFQVAEIAYRVGYANPANFTNAFRRQFGYAPKFEITKT
ncbi:MAG: AraC family transcriptional regulator, partial [Cohaesibacter sp.]|nr:AraC family transcriptional regulator [Cohaesibacter sp.]